MKTLLIVVGVLVLLPVLAVGGVGGWLWVTGTPLIDEWACSQGEAPYLYAEGGSACAKEGSTLPAGATWDPFGNRPLACHHRKGWMEVEPLAASQDTGTACVRNGAPIPDGWRRAG